MSGAGRLGNGYFPARGSQTEMIDLAKRTAEQHVQVEELVKRLESYCPNLQIIQP